MARFRYLGAEPGQNDSWMKPVPIGSAPQLTRRSKLTRQAITKHLRVLERAGIVHSVRAGRESRFQFDPQPMEGIKEYLDFVSHQWDRALSRLKSFVED
jgi:DNA-binding transcriptional ArsR family regulator